MQNFTLGKKGYSMLLFALILLIGSSPTFGQTNCPTVTNTPSNQSFCFLQTVGDIVTDGNAIFATANSTTDTQPIPDSELLDNTTYYAGNQASSCTSRIAINVTVNAAPYPNNTLFPGENSFTISPCTNDFTAEELETYFTPLAGYNIEVYSEEFGNTVATGPLTPNESYFVGQVNPSQNNSTATNCPSLRVAVGYEPKQTPPPTADSPQTYCEGATVADLQAQGTSPDTQAIRWYRTNTSFQPLPNSTILIDGQTYYATQIINDRNDPFPPCESTTRTPVTVIIQPLTIVETTQSFCESIGEGNNFRKPQVQDLEPQGGTFFAEENSTTPLDPSTELANNEDYFNRDNGDDCSQDRITVSFDDTPNAGSTTQTTACENDPSFNLVDRINDSQIGPADRNGTFSPALSTGTQIFNPEDYSPGSYTFTYTVGSTSSCPADSAVITVEVQEAPNAGPGGNITVCSNDIPAILANPAQFAGLLPTGITPGGTFNPTLNQLAVQFVSNPSAPLTTTYTVNNSNGCSDSASYTLNVAPGPNAGDDSEVTLSTEQDPVNLFTYIQGNPDTGGTFSPGNANGDLDPADYTPGDYTFTYTVTTPNGCSDSSELIVTITSDIICPVIADTTQEFCESISDSDGNNPRRPQVRDLMPMNTVWYATATSTVALAQTETLADDEDYFAGNANGDCPNRERVFVQIGKAPNAGATTNIAACSTEDPFDIVSRLNPSILGPADAGGTISPALASGTTIFDPTVDTAGQYTYTVRSEFGKCEDDSTIVNITIVEPTPANAGADVTLTFCSTEGNKFLFSFLPEGISSDGTFAGLTNGIFDTTTAAIGVTEITYTIDSNDGCFSGSDSSTFVITILQGPNAGTGGATTLSTTQDPVNLFSYIGGNPNVGGLFSPGNEDGSLDPSEYTPGNYNFTYTVTSPNGCTDSSNISVTITNDIVCPEVTDTTQEFCESISDATGNNPRRPQVRDLMPLNTVWYATATSTEPLLNTTVLVNDEDYFAGNQNGTCPTRGRVLVIIDEAPNAGATTNLIICKNEGSFDLVTRINPSILGDADAGGTITPALASGTTIFDPAVDVARQYRYTVQSENNVCPTDDTTINITINDAPDAPTAEANQSFCLVDGPTVGDIVVTGSNVVIYTDSDLTDEADVTTSLVSGMNYYATSTGEGETCSSDAIEITVTITDPASPTLSLDGKEFCRSDNPTVQELINNFTGGVVIYNASTGGASISSSTPLQNGATYYAASVNGTTGCESSERTAVVAKVEFCGIPEGFSPNGDGINDRFVIPEIAENFPNYTIEIFNRWGQVVFKGNSSTPDWDGFSNQSGTLGNDVLPVGVYFYILNYNDGQTSPVQGKLYLSI